METTELFQKHFGNTPCVSLEHPNIENFFEELNEICLLEDKQRNCKHSWDYKIMFNHEGKNVCEKCGLVKNQ